METGRLRFTNVKLGGTSWVLPGGGSFSDNMKKLSADVDNMEIVLWDNEYGCNIPSKDDVKRLRGLREELGMSCCVHFSTNVSFETSSESRTRCEDKCLRTMELFHDLDPYAWVLHLHGEVFGPVPSNDMDWFYEATRKSSLRLASATDEPWKICAENLDFSLDYIIETVKEAGFSICLDLGHLVHVQEDVKANVEKFLPYTRILHLHGVKPDLTDHVDLSYYDQNLLEWIFRRLADGTDRIMDLEVFESDYDKSIEILRKFKAERNL